MNARAACAAVSLIAAACAASAQTTAPETEKPPVDAGYGLPILEIIGFDFMLNRVNQRFSGSTDYDVTARSIRANLRGPWVVDNDPFKVNQFAHPYQGSIYHAAGRSTGLNYWESAALTFGGSAMWEIAGERTKPSRNDQIASGIAGSFLGEPLFRMARLALKSGSSVPPQWREWVAGAISPPVGFNRLAYGSRFDDAFDDHDPAYYGRVHLGLTHVTGHGFEPSPKFKENMAQADFAMDYGMPGKDGYTYTRPFDYFSFQLLASSANGIENLSTRGLIFGTDYAYKDAVRGIWGIYGTYDYLSPQIFHISSTSLSVGSTAQAWLSKSVALQGTALLGIGYAAASTASGPLTDASEYHYGVAPRMALASRMTFGDRFSAEVSARRIVLGRVARRAGGTDDVTRVDTSFTWRVSGRHAVSVNYLWSHRSAQFLSAPGRKESLGTVGLYYTLLSKQGLGAVEWR
jgi:hypothetical protein